MARGALSLSEQTIVDVSAGLIGSVAQHLHHPREVRSLQ
ncbi:hypothetical protein DB31_8525 [Hyalangium minutum]|uniref:Uncharacterized protein n=1 Tax=Hyalangium minutum TaxID=394096 RepID=A0A085WHK9_9BACT|nr:hypothetical protein DB31_8525 [Hyalangium minutum]